MFLETKRLLLRPWEETDAPSLFMYASDPDIGPSAGWAPHTSEENSLHIIRNVLAVPGTFAVVPRAVGQAVGSVSLMLGTDSGRNLPAGEAEIGYWIGKPFWGQGLIPEAVRALQRYAFETLGVCVLWCGYFEGNEKSRRVQEKCGFRPDHDEQTHWPQINRTITEHFTRLSREEYEDALCSGTLRVEM